MKYEEQTKCIQISNSCLSSYVYFFLFLHKIVMMLSRRVSAAMEACDAGRLKIIPEWSMLNGFLSKCCSFYLLLFIAGQFLNGLDKCEGFMFVFLFLYLITGVNMGSRRSDKIFCSPSSGSFSLAV